VGTDFALRINNKRRRTVQCLRNFLRAAAGAALAYHVAAMAQTGVAVGDIVQTAVNGARVFGEVIATHGATADLNLGQNQISRFVSVQYLHVVQRSGGPAHSGFAVGDVVQAPYVAGTVITGRIMKTNGAYCEIDSSGSGFTGWNLCSELTGTASRAGATSPPAAASRNAPAGPGSIANPGRVSCAGKIEGRYSTPAGQGGLNITFHSGAATVRGPLTEDEEAECWISGKRLILHSPKETEDLSFDINDDGTLDTPFGELKKKG
jgi:hypothetical protein